MNIITRFNGKLAEIIIVEVVDDDFDLAYQFLPGHCDTLFELFLEVLIYKGIGTV